MTRHSINAAPTTRHASRSPRENIAALVVACMTGFTFAAEPPATAIAPPSSTITTPAAFSPFAQDIPVAAIKLDMLPVPGSPDGSIKPFYIAKTELTWEAFDVYVYRLDEEAGNAPKNADAISRPSKPYLPPDRGFGHEGYAAICLSYKNATEFCVWLSAATGRHYRLPTEAEWELAASASLTGSSDTKSPATTPTGTCIPANASLADVAWFADNSSESPHPVATKAPNALGVHDMLGNVAEWVIGKDGKPTTKGGSYRDPADKLTITANAPQDSSWNSSDPQIPKSKWWLSDGPFIGFRIVCDAPALPPAPTKSPSPADAPK